MRVWTLLVVIMVGVGCSSSAEDDGEATPDGGGAPGRGCDEPDPDWLFCEDFASDDGDFDAWLERSDFVRALGGDDRGRIDLSDKGFPTCEEQQQCCSGDNFRPDDPVALPVGEWFCLEMMMEANASGASDGRMAYWVDDELAHEVTGLRWRTTNDLQLDRVGLQHYIAEGDADSPNRVWFDDVVVSTEPIGCPR